MNENLYRIHLFCIYVLLLVPVLQAQNPNDNILWSAKFSHDGAYLAVGGGTVHGLRIYRATDFRLLHTFPIHEITQMSWHPVEHELLAVVVQPGDRAGLLNVATQEIQELAGVASTGARGIGWNHDGSLLGVADNEGRIVLWSKEGRLVRTISKENTKSYTALAWHPTEDRILVVSENIREYNLRGGLERIIRSRTADVLMLAIQWHKSGEFFVSGDYGHDNIPTLLQFWGEDGKRIGQSDASQAEIRNLSWSQDGEKLATASDALRIYSKEGELIAEGPSQDLLWGVDWRPDGKYIVTSSIEGHVKIWDPFARLIRELK